jgi:ABC-type transporter Mla subunit MlaD
VITNGSSESSIAELQRQIHDEILPKLDNALVNIGEVSESLRKEVFNPEGIKNLQVTLANFRTTSEMLASSSGQIKGVTDQANLFLKKGNSAMDSVTGAAGDMKAFIINLRQHGIIFYRDTAPQPAATGPLKKKP